MTLEALPYISLLGFLFGSTLVASRFSVGQFHPTTYIGLRLSLAGVSHMLLYLFLSRRYKWPKDRHLWLQATLLGVLGTAVPMTSIVTSLQYLSSGIASIMITTGPAITVIMAHFWLADESLTRRKSVGVMLALAGTLLLALSGESGLQDVSRANPIGYLLLLLAVIIASFATIYIRKFMGGYNSFDIASIRMFSASLTVMPLSFLFVGFDLHAVTGQGYFALIYAALVGTFSGLLLAVYNIQRFGATAAAMTAYVIPIVAGLGGVLFLGERITAVMLVGMALIIGGIAILNQRTVHVPI
ncbi:MAG: DMT family transporter [Anaerolineales bacterium]|nr:DMT family transporter [Anaerolineales bacterium]